MICLSSGCKNGANHKGYCKYHRSRNHLIHTIETQWRKCTGCDHGYSAINPMITRHQNFDWDGTRYIDDKNTVDYINKLVLQNRKNIGDILYPCERTKELDKYGVAHCTDTMFGFCMFCNGYKLDDRVDTRWNNSSSSYHFF
ncbi:hypothetical protein ENVG_00318 [Emiliania huxleyi virus 84]|nr:hypothetical protein ENVG_00318 [Emiliania huxleyi virus 84]AEP15347.1 hypothetical protein EOVG_00410 [Emiliania huxleyi virus 88]